MAKTFKILTSSLSFAMKSLIISIFSLSTAKNKAVLLNYELISSILKFKHNWKMLNKFD